LAAAHLRKRLQWKLILLALVIALGITIIAATAIGPVEIPFAVVISTIAGLGPTPSPVERTIVLDIRLPRIILGILVGAALGVAGTAMQGLFKNPMADPYIIGISSGAALGASIAIVTFSSSFYALLLMAFVMATLTVFIVYSIASIGGKVPVATLLLAGIAVGTFMSALTSFIMYTSGENLHGIVFWLMGGLWGRSWIHVFIILPWVILGSAVIFIFARDLNAMLLGEESAQHLGIEVETVKKILIVSASLITAVAVAVSGIIGFVGLIIPHIMRLLVGSDHRILIPSSALVGGIFLVWADTISRTVISPTEIPVGIITALFGAPFFVYLLRRKKRVVS
jgi:iron complex transport system permease protein